MMTKQELMIKAEGGESAVKRLAEIVSVLRAPDGCPWDKEQTHDSLKRPMIEEAYEVIEAIESKDDANLREELGDVLLQVMFHSEIARTEGRFSLADVANEECEKMIRRHPHIFGELENNIDTKTVLENWDVIKKQEKKNESQTDSMNKIPRGLPALYRADKVQAKAKKVGFDWDSVDGALDKVLEERGEVIQAIAAGDREELKKEVGDLLFAAVNVARMLDIDPEEALNSTTAKFISRFSYVEKNMQAGMSLDELDKLWEAAKAIEKAAEKKS